jgi:hypothetical protein
MGIICQHILRPPVPTGGVIELPQGAEIVQRSRSAAILTVWLSLFPAERIAIQLHYDSFNSEQFSDPADFVG